MNLKLGTIEASLASCDKVIATWLPYEKYVFGIQYPQSHNNLLFFVSSANATTCISGSFKIIYFLF